jgi:hypothetical protein
MVTRSLHHQAWEHGYILDKTTIKHKVEKMIDWETGKEFNFLNSYGLVVHGD